MPKPIAVCLANEVEAWDYPFFLRPAAGLEPAFLFLEDHIYNLALEDESLLEGMVRIDNEEDLRKLGYRPSEDGIYRI